MWRLTAVISVLFNGRIYCRLRRVMDRIGRADNTRAMHQGNNGPHIFLWSFHPPEFSLLDGHIRPERSNYRDDPAIVAAYAKLHRLLGTDQIIWCYTRRDDFSETSRQVIEWALQVPTVRVRAFYDSLVWARIIGRAPCTLPDDQRRRIRSEAIRAFPNDPQRRRAFEEARTADVWNEPEPEGGWWTRLFVKHPDRDGIDALIRHPIEPAWVRSKTLRGFRRPGVRS